MGDILDDPPKGTPDEVVDFVLKATAMLGTRYMQDCVEDKGKRWLKNELSQWLYKNLPALIQDRQTEAQVSELKFVRSLLGKEPATAATIRLARYLEERLAHLQREGKS